MHETVPDVRHASDHSLLVTFAEEISRGAHRRVREAFEAMRREPIRGVTNLHPAYATLLVSYDPASVDRDALQALVAERVRIAPGREIGETPVKEVPVVYGGDAGPDLAMVAQHCGLAEADVVREHAAGAYYVAFLGFSPGFPYLGGLPPAIATPRRATPRTRVEAGSVAIGGNQAGIYPLSSPGGWQVVGRTPVALFDPRRVQPAALEIGDRVRFVPVPAAEFESGGRSHSQAVAAKFGSEIRVVSAGFQSTVQDLGRPGYAHLGVSASGAADPFSLRVGNRLVGNVDESPAIEMTLVGGTFQFEGATTIAVTGSDFSPALAGRPIPLWVPVEVRPGEALTFGATRGGARCTLCVRGGLDVESVLESASTHLTSGLGGLGGSALRNGDVLAVGTSARPREGRASGCAPASRMLGRSEIRVVRGAQWESFAPAARSALFSSPYRVREDSSRMGLRLAGPALVGTARGEMITEGVSLGALQVPEGGQPIISFVEHQTTGGYPQIACVIAADLHRVGQLRPRDEVRFVEVTLEKADAARRELDAALPGDGGGE